jgi:hypothetical protein
MRKPLVFIALIIINCSSCNRNNIIPEQEMVDILVKVFITDATVISPHLHRPISRLDSINYYAWAYESLGYTEHQFEVSLNHYTSNPDKLNKILDKVISELSRIETEIEPKLLPVSEVSLDSISNLWNEKQEWYLPADGSQNPIYFKIPAVGPGIYTLSAEVRVFPDDQSQSTTMTSYFYFDDGTEQGVRSGLKVVPYLKDGESRVVTLSNTIIKSEVTYIMGMVMDHSPQEGNWSKHSEIKNITLQFTPLPDPLKPKRLIKKDR